MELLARLDTLGCRLFALRGNPPDIVVIQIADNIRREQPGKLVQQALLYGKYADIVNNPPSCDLFS